MSDMTIEFLIEAAYQHAARLTDDIELCKTREEHIRVTARANEAHHLAARLSELAGELTGNLIG